LLLRPNRYACTPKNRYILDTLIVTRYWLLATRFECPPVICTIWCDIA